MAFLLSKLLPLALYPLGLSLALQIGGLLGRRRRWGPWLSGGGLTLLWLASTPWLSHELVWSLEERASRLTPNPVPRADAVLVLGGGVRPALEPRRRVELGEAGDRLLTGIALVRKGKAPLLVLSGGRVSFAADDPAPAEAASAIRLARELGIPSRQLRSNPDLGPDGPRNTGEEAEALGRLARQQGWRSLLLVSSATHLPRALSTFRRRLPPELALHLIPVACDYQLPARHRMGRPTAASALLNLLPSADALANSTAVLKEYLGLLLEPFRGKHP